MKKKERKGQPHAKPRDKDKRRDILVRTTPEEHAKLKKIAERNTWSLSTAGERAIKEFNERYGEVHSMTKAFLAKHGVNT